MHDQPLGQHLVLRLGDSRVILDQPAQRWLALRLLFKLGRDKGLLAFCFADTHVHLQVACSRAAAGQLARRLQIALKLGLKLPVSFQPAYFEPIAQQRHLYNTLRYIHSQWRHHGLQGDAFAEASSLPDLLGLRAAGGSFLAANVRRWLPRLKSQDLLEHFAVASLAPVAYEPALDALHLLAATAAAAGLADLHAPYQPEVIQARCALLQVAGKQLRRTQAAELLHVNRATIFRLRQKTAPHELVAAIRQQLSLSRQLADQTSKGAPRKNS